MADSPGAGIASVPGRSGVVVEDEANLSMLSDAELAAEGLSSRFWPVSSEVDSAMLIL